MCLSVVAQVEELLENGDAIVNLSGVRKEVELGLLEGKINVGEWILIHTGFAISVVDETKAKEMLDAMQEAEHA